MSEMRGELDDVLDEVLGEEGAAGDDDEIEVEEAVSEAPTVAEKEACGSLEGLTEDELIPPVEEEEALPTTVRIGEVDGIPLFYGRDGAPHAAEFPIAPAFRDHLTRTVKMVRRRVPDGFGRLVRITSAGAFVNKPGFHGLGRAFDHDVWLFEEVEISPFRGDHASSSLARRRRYWALAALFRSRSAHVLHGEYNAAHRDHIHHDDGGPFAFTTTSEATVKLVQAVCNDIYGTSPRLVVDGDFGSASQTALRDAMQRVHLEGDVSDLVQWRRFLRRTGRLGFRLSLGS